MGLEQTVKSPSFKVDPIRWNQAWERDLAVLYGTSTAIPPVVTDDAVIKKVNILDVTAAPSGLVQALPDDEGSLQSMQVQKRQICILQRDLSAKISRRYAENDFERVWTENCTQKQREKFILDGLAKTCEASPDFEPLRRWCPEVTLPRLNRNNGRGYLDLIKGLVHQDIENVPYDYKSIENAFWYALIGRSATTSAAQRARGHNIVVKQFEISRTYFLSMFVWITLLNFYGESEEYGLTKSGQHSNEKMRALASEDDLPSDVLRKVASDRKMAEYACHSCGLPPSKSGAERLSACQRCRAIGRHVYYCGKECQTTDWKSGHPPHKSVCVCDGLAEYGKRHWSSETWLYPITSLLHQIKLLNENPEFDYLYIQPYPHPDHGVMFKDSMGSMFFRIMRERAMTSHSPYEVKKMYDQMAGMLSGFGGDSARKMKEQLKREYDVDVDTVKKTGSDARKVDVEELRGVLNTL